MQLEKLEYFLEVARTGSMNLAAQNLNLSHQALNQSIHSLERELGVKLIDGNFKGVALTEKGQLLNQSAKRIIQEWNQLKLNLNDDLQQQKHIILGFAPYAENMYYTKLWVYLRDNFPKIQLQMINVYLSDAIEQLANRQLDLAVLSILKKEIAVVLAENNYLDYITLISLKTSFCVNKNSPLAKKKALLWGDLQEVPIIISRTGDINKNPQMLEARKNGCNNILMVHSDDILQEMVAGNLGISLWNDRSFFADEYKNKITSVPCGKDLELDMEIGIFVLKDRADDDVIKLIIQKLKSIFV